MGFYKRQWVQLHKRKRRTWPVRPWDKDDVSLYVDESMYIFGHPRYEEEFLFMPTLKDLLGPVAGSGAGGAARDPVLEEKMPCLHMLLCAVKHDDGSKRDPAMLTVVTEQGMWKAGIKEKTLNASLWRSGETLQMALQALENALSEGTADWRVPKAYKGR